MDRPTTATSHPSSAGSKRTPVRVEGDVLIREVSKSDRTPVVCDRADVPGGSTCAGVPVVGVDWGQLMPHDHLGPDDVNAANAAVSGIYGDGALTIDGTSRTDPGQQRHRSPIDPRCVEPTGGWASQRGAAISWGNWDKLVQSLAADREVLSFAFAPFEDFTDYSDTGGAPAATFLPTIDWPLTAHTVLVVYVDGDLDRHHTELTARFHGPICVLASTRTTHAATDAERILTSSAAESAGVQLVRVDAAGQGELFIVLAIIDDEIAAWVADHLGDTRTGVWIIPLLRIVS